MSEYQSQTHPDHEGLQVGDQVYVTRGGLVRVLGEVILTPGRIPAADAEGPTIDYGYYHVRPRYNDEASGPIMVVAKSGVVTGPNESVKGDAGHVGGTQTSRWLISSAGDE